MYKRQPPTRGVWVPAWVSHAIRMSGEPRMRTVFVEPGAASHLPTECCVLSISPLLRELMVAAAEVPLDWQPRTRDGRLMMLLLDELKQEPVLPLHLPQMCIRDSGDAAAHGAGADDGQILQGSIHEGSLALRGARGGRHRRNRCV